MLFDANVANSKIGMGNLATSLFMLLVYRKMGKKKKKNRYPTVTQQFASCEVAHLCLYIGNGQKFNQQA